MDKSEAIDFKALLDADTEESKAIQAHVDIHEDDDELFEIEHFGEEVAAEPEEEVAAEPEIEQNAGEGTQGDIQA